MARMPKVVKRFWASLMMIGFAAEKLIENIQY